MSIDTLRLFQECRLHPWIPEHKVQIEAHLASLKVQDEAKHARFRKLYDEKEANYVAPVEPAKEEVVVEVVLDEEPEVVEKKKPKKKAKKSSPST